MTTCQPTSLQSPFSAAEDVPALVCGDPIISLQARFVLQSLLLHYQKAWAAAHKHYCTRKAAARSRHTARHEKLAEFAELRRKAPPPPPPPPPAPAATPATAEEAADEAPAEAAAAAAAAAPAAAAPSAIIAGATQALTPSPGKAPHDARPKVTLGGVRAVPPQPRVAAGAPRAAIALSPESRAQSLTAKRPGGGEAGAAVKRARLDSSGDTSAPGGA